MLTNEEKREAIEKALGRCVPKREHKEVEIGLGVKRIIDRIPLVGLDYTALAEEAIVIPVEIEHYFATRRNPEAEKLRGADEPPVEWLTRVPRTFIKAYTDGHIGKPGMAIAIIIPEEESDEDGIL